MRFDWKNCHVYVCECIRVWYHNYFLQYARPTDSERICVEKRNSLQPLSQQRLVPWLITVIRVWKPSWSHHIAECYSIHTATKTTKVGKGRSSFTGSFTAGIGPLTSVIGEDRVYKGQSKVTHTSRPSTAKRQKADVFRVGKGIKPEVLTNKPVPTCGKMSWVKKHWYWHD